MKKISYIKIIKKIFTLLSSRRKKVLIFFFILTLVGAFAEVVSIALIIPFADLIIDPEKINIYFSKINFELNINENNINYWSLVITLFFIFAFVFSNLVKFFLGYLGHLISNNTTHEMNAQMFKSFLFANQTKGESIDENRINSSILKMHSVTVLFTQILGMFSSIIILFAILLLLINIVQFDILAAILFVFFFYLVLIKVLKKIFSKNSAVLSKSLESRTNIISNTVGLLKLIKVNNLENFFIKKFYREDYKIAKTTTLNAALISFPGILLITATVVLSAALIYFLRLKNIDFTKNLPTIFALVFSIQKIVPLGQNIFSANAKFQSNYFQAFSALGLISSTKKDLDFSPYEKNNFKVIKYKNIEFGYKKKILLKKLNLEIQKGDRILIKGKSGSGKTTLINILLGILLPKKGLVTIDKNILYKKNFKKLKNFYSYTPQDTFVFNGTISENISLETDAKKINYAKLIECAKNSQIFSFINKNKKKFDTKILYMGRNISGGQKQRIGIARTLYKNSDIYIFDESTSSLDSKTEEKIIKIFKNKYLDKTIIFISHKNFKDEFFNKKFVLKNKKLTKL